MIESLKKALEWRDQVIGELATDNQVLKRLPGGCLWIGPRETLYAQSSTIALIPDCLMYQRPWAPRARAGITALFRSTGIDPAVSGRNRCH